MGCIGRRKKRDIYRLEPLELGSIGKSSGEPLNWHWNALFAELFIGKWPRTALFTPVLPRQLMGSRFGSLRRKLLCNVSHPIARIRSDQQKRKNHLLNHRENCSYARFFPPPARSLFLLELFNWNIYLRIQYASETRACAIAHSSNDGRTTDGRSRENVYYFSDCSSFSTFHMI